jgi:hypothetical protein
MAESAALAMTYLTDSGSSRLAKRKKTLYNEFIIISIDNKRTFFA